MSSELTLLTALTDAMSLVDYAVIDKSDQIIVSANGHFLSPGRTQICG